MENCGALFCGLCARTLVPVEPDRAHVTLVDVRHDLPVEAGVIEIRPHPDIAGEQRPGERTWCNALDPGQRLLLGHAQSNTAKLRRFRRCLSGQETRCTTTCRQAVESTRCDNGPNQTKFSQK